MKKVFLAAALLLMSISSQSYAAIVTTIGSATVTQGSSGGFFNVPISINSNSGSAFVGAYLVDFFVLGTPANSLQVFNQGTAGSTLFNSAGLIGFGNYDISTSYSSTGTIATLSLLSSTPTSIPVDGIGTLAFLPVSTNLPLGTYSLQGTIIGIQSGTGIDIDGPINIGTFTVQAVPEPSTFALLTAVGISGVAIRRFRSARSKSTV